MASELEVMLRGRQAGKTTQALEWLSHGVRIPGYPGWSRVIVTPNKQMWKLTTDLARRNNGLFGDDADLAHRIYFLEDWNRAFVTGVGVEVLLEDVEYMLRLLVNHKGRVRAITLTGEPVADGQWLEGNAQA